MRELQALLEHLRIWSAVANKSKRPFNSSRLATIFLGISTPEQLPSLRGAPAHPIEMREWLIRVISERASATNELSKPILDVRAQDLLLVLPLVLRHTNVSDWPPTKINWRQIRGTVSYTKDGQEVVDTLLSDGNLRRFFRRLGGFSLSAPDWAWQRAVITVRDSWRWPLTIGIDDVLLTDRHLRRASRIFERTGLVKLIPYKEGQGGAIRLVAGNSSKVLETLRPEDKERFAYIIGTGEFGKTSDLQKITNKARSGGAAMLGWSAEAIPRRLVQLLKHGLQASRAHDTFDLWLNRALSSRKSIFYAHRLALNWTAPSRAATSLAASLNSHFFNSFALDIESVSTPLLGLTDLRDPVNLSRLLAQAKVPESRDETAEWLRQIGTLSTALQRSELLNSFDNLSASYSQARSAQPRASEVTDSQARREEQQIAKYPMSREVYAQASLISNGGVIHRLSETAPNVLKVQLASSNLNSVQADHPFPAHMLPDNSESIELTFLLVPLAGVLQDSRGKAQRGEAIFSKTTGESSVCDFPLYPLLGAHEYRARLLIVHGNRVLQSLMVYVPGSAAVETSVMRLVAENIIKSDFSGLTAGKPYDLAIVANHDDANATQNGLLMLTQSKVEFREPKNFGEKLKAIYKQFQILNEENDIPATTNGIAKHRAKSLNELANLGYDMRQSLCQGNDDLTKLTSDSLDPSNPTRIQVVEAVPDAFLPVEMFYDGPAPLENAPICAKVAPPLYPTETCMGCTDRNRADLICPSRFWGLSKVIERRPFMANAVSLGADYAVHAPRSNHAKVPNLRNIVCGLSEKFSADEATEIAAALSNIGENIIPVTNWNAWEAAVAQNGPEILVAIAHVQPRHAGISALEIGNDLLRCTNITQSHVRNHADDSPIIVLLGCGTMFTPDEIGNFVRHFSGNGAGLIVATIASMHTQQAQPCVDALIQAFDRARSADPTQRKSGFHTVGSAILRAKQQLMADGSDLALALTGAGDGEWEF